MAQTPAELKVQARVCWVSKLCYLCLSPPLSHWSVVAALPAYQMHSMLAEEQLVLRHGP